MKNLMMVTIIALVMTMAHEIAAVQQAHKHAEVPVQYTESPTDGNYIHGEFCMDSRVF